MSWGTCFSGSNNIDFNFPPIMSDARNYSSWQPDAIVNQRIQKKEGIKSNWEYRQFLQKNGAQIINFNSAQACSLLGLDSHIQSDRTPSSNVPYTFRNTFDTSQPGFGYCNSDLKNPYLTREQLNSRMMSVHINPANIVNSQNIVNPATIENTSNLLKPENI
jgi:hypothetical protein